MTIERTVGEACVLPFPVYPQLVETLTAAHLTAPEQRHRTLAHVLATCAGYAYADTETVARMVTRLGLERHACVRITQTVDAMFIYSTAYLVQSQCGRVVFVCYRGTEPATFGNWLGDADIGPERTTLPLADGDATVGMHAGFHRNVRATWWEVLEELTIALQGGSIADHGTAVAHPLEALYVTGHSLGGAMALLFALRLSAAGPHRAIADRLRAVYTFGQPMAVVPPLPPGLEAVGRKVFRHVLVQDPVPALPPARWGPFVHVGHEYRYVDGEWQQAASPVAQLAGLSQLSRSVLAFFASEKHRGSSRYTFAEHGPQHYIAALRPPDRVTEFGDGAQA